MLVIFLLLVVIVSVVVGSCLISMILEMSAYNATTDNLVIATKYGSIIIMAIAILYAFIRIALM